MIPDLRPRHLIVAPEARGPHARAQAAAAEQADVATLRARIAGTLEAYARAAEALAVATMTDVGIEDAYRARQTACATVCGALLALFFALADEPEQASAVAQQVEDMRRHPLSCEQASTWAREHREAAQRG